MTMATTPQATFHHAWHCQVYDGSNACTCGVEYQATAWAEAHSCHNGVVLRWCNNRSATQAAIYDHVMLASRQLL